MSFERALHVRTTPFACVGDILKAVGEEDRRDFRYCHLAFAIRTDFPSRPYGTCRRLGAHHVSFRPTKCRGEQKGSPGLGACQSEKQELRTGPVALRQRLDRQHCAPIIRKSRGKMTAAVRACRRAGGLRGSALQLIKYQFAMLLEYAERVENRLRQLRGMARGERAREDYALASGMGLHFGDVPVGLGKMLLFLSAIHDLRRQQEAPTGPGL